MSQIATRAIYSRKIGILSVKLSTLTQEASVGDSDGTALWQGVVIQRALPIHIAVSVTLSVLAEDGAGDLAGVAGLRRGQLQLQLGAGAGGEQIFHPAGQNRSIAKQCNHQQANESHQTHHGDQVVHRIETGGDRATTIVRRLIEAHENYA